jgi:Holliday junction resolvase
MGNRNYKRGYQLENWICKFLSYHGYHCKRNYGSKGVEDIVAIKKGHPPLFIQCKSSTVTDKLQMTKEQINNLREHAREYGCIAIIVYSYRAKKYWYNTETDNTEEIVPVETKRFNKWAARQKKEKAKRKIKSCNVVISISKVFMRIKGFITS